MVVSMAGRTMTPSAPRPKDVSFESLEPECIREDGKGELQLLMS